jgi:hypothetical protein
MRKLNHHTNKTSTKEFRPSQNSFENKLVSKLFLFALFLLPFGVIYQPEKLGYLAASPAIPLFMILGLLRLFKVGKFDVLGHAARLLYLWGVISSLFAIVIFGWSDLSGSKAISYIFLCAAWMAPLLCMGVVSKGDLKIGLIAGLCVSLFAYVTSDLFVNFWPASIREFLFHGDYVNYLDGRPRGFEAEPSQFSANLGRYLFAIFLLSEVKKNYSSKRLMVFLSFMALCMIICASKGAAITIAIVILLVAIKKSFYKYGIFLLPVLYYIVINQAENLTFDIENFTSTSTRIAMLITALLAFLCNPFGYGFYGFYDVMSYFGVVTFDFFSDSSLNLQEFEFVVKDLKNVSFKSSLLDFLIIFGSAFIAFIFFLLRKINFSDPRVGAGFVYFISSAAYVEGHTSIMFFVGLSILFLYYKKA